MIQAVFFRGEGGLAGFEASGHAGYANSGSDIVCAAVSAVLLTACEGLESVVGANPAVTQKDEDGFLSLSLPASLPESVRRDASLVLEVAQAGIRAISRQYPDHVRLISRKRRQNP